MKTSIVLIMLVLILAVCVGAVVWLRSGPRASDFAHLIQPRVTRMNDQRVLVVEAEGDPNVVGARAFKLLLATYFKLEGVSRAGRPPAPRARWPEIQHTPRTKWLGRYALPLPDGVTSAPIAQTEPGLRIAIETWRYGEVAEVLHVGPYSTEEPDIRRLLDFVASQGYGVVGDHEEEYVRGPGMMFMGDPDKYLTIIRVRVQKTDRVQN